MTTWCCAASADEERVLVEMACGASLAAVYGGLIPRLQDEGNTKSHPHLALSLNLNFAL